MGTDWINEGEDGNRRLIAELERRRAQRHDAGGGAEGQPRSPSRLEALTASGLDASFESTRSGGEAYERAEQFMQAMERRLPNAIPWGIDRKAFAFKNPPGKKLAPLTEAELAPQMIPGYTGHVSGLKRTIGLTYGNTTGPLLGKISPAFIPMHDSREQEKEIVLQRTGYPTYQHSLWQRSRPDTAHRKKMRDPISREVGSDIVQRIANQLVSRVNGKTAFPMNKVSLELKRACDEVFQQRVGLRDGGHHYNADPSSELTEEQARRAFQLLRIELHEKDIQHLFHQLSRPTDRGKLRVDVLCDALVSKQTEHPLAKSNYLSKRGMSQNSQNNRPSTQQSAMSSSFRPKTPWAVDDL